MRRFLVCLAVLPLCGCDQAAVLTGGKTNEMPAVVAPVADLMTHSSQINAGRAAADKLKAIGAQQQQDLQAADQIDGGK